MNCYREFEYGEVLHKKLGPDLLNPFPNEKILDSSKQKEFADKNFNFYENGRKFFKRVKNTVEKGEIA